MLIIPPPFIPHGRYSGGGPSSFKDIIICIIVAMIFIWMILTLDVWLFPFDGHPTLIEVLGNEFNWLSKLRIW